MQDMTSFYGSFCANNGKDALNTLEFTTELFDQAPESTVGRPMAVCRQGIYVEYSMEYSKCRALN
eukprot:1739286-Pyramimonas_sp.AAC.1